VVTQQDGGQEKAALAAGLGARRYIDATAGDVAGQLQQLGGAQVVLATAPSSQAMADTLDGLTPNRELIVLGFAPDPIPVPTFPLIVPSRTVRGYPADVEDAVAFAHLTGIQARTLTLRLTEAAKGYQRMLAKRGQIPRRAHYVAEPAGTGRQSSRRRGPLFGYRPRHGHLPAAQRVLISLAYCSDPKLEADAPGLPGANP
jgi:D-arabinose 1-dehydrogenase-like Zn-dependent alcohol dehydrogenase